MNSFFTGTELFNTNNISIRELNKFNYLKDPLNLRFDQSNVRLNAKNTNNNNFFNDCIIKKIPPIPNSNHKQRISSSNYYIDLIDISHKSNNKQYSRESPLLNDKDLNGTLGSIPLDKIVLENTMAVEKNIVNMSDAEYIARKLQADENANDINSIMSLDVLNSQLELNHQKRLDIALQTAKPIPVKINRSSSGENKSIKDNLIETEDLFDEFIEHQKKMRQINPHNTDKSVDEPIYTLDNLDDSMPVSMRNDINNGLILLKDTEDSSFINEMRNIMFSTNQRSISNYERNNINQLSAKYGLPPIKNQIKIKFSIIRNLSSMIKSKVNVIENDENIDISK